MIRLAAVLTVLLAINFAACSRNSPSTEAESPSKDPHAPRPMKVTLMALYRFWDTRNHEHVYTYGEGEPANWRKNPAFKNESIVGYVALAPQPDTARLYRAYCRDMRHYFYLEKPPGANDIDRMESFEVYVWIMPGDGRIPIHACLLPDHKDAYFDKNLGSVQEYAASTVKTPEKQRRVIETMFYVYPTSVQTTPPLVSPVRPAPWQSAGPEFQALAVIDAEVVRDENGTVVQVNLRGKKLGDSAIRHLKGLRGLQSLDLSMNPLTDAVLELSQGAWPNLEELNLDGTRVTDKGVELLQRSTPRLKILSLTGNRGVTDKGIARLAKLPLTRLHVTGTGVTDSGLASIEKLSDLEELYCGNRLVTDAGVAHLKVLRNLKSLALGDSGVTDLGLVHLKGLSKLELLVLDRTEVTDAGLVHLKGLMGLKRLRLSETAVTPTAEAALRKAIPGLAIQR